MAIEGYPSVLAYFPAELSASTPLAYKVENFLGNPRDVVAYNVDPIYWIPVGAGFHITPKSSATWLIHGTMQFENEDGGQPAIKAELHQFDTGNAAAPYTRKTQDGSGEITIVIGTATVHIGFIPTYTDIGTDSDTTGVMVVYTGASHDIDCVIQLDPIWRAVGALPEWDTTIYDAAHVGFDAEEFHFPDSLEEE